jgi:hypothetical protein
VHQTSTPGDEIVVNSLALLLAHEVSAKMHQPFPHVTQSKAPQTVIPPLSRRSRQRTCQPSVCARLGLIELAPPRRLILPNLDARGRFARSPHCAAANESHADASTAIHMTAHVISL